MLARRSLALAVLIVVVSQKSAGASPITYDFTGTFLQNGMVNGSHQISGSFTINSNPPPSSGLSPAIESGSNVSITINAGGQVYSFANTPQNPSVATFTAYEWLPGSPPNPMSSQPLIEYAWSGSMPSVNPTLNFWMAFYDPGGIQSLNNAMNFNYNLVTSSFDFGGSLLGSGQGGDGSITSITLVSAPEPSTFAAFTVLGIAAIVHRRWKR